MTLFWYHWTSFQIFDVQSFKRSKDGVWYRVSQVEDLTRNIVRGLAFHSSFERSLALVLMPWRKAWGLTRETLPVMLCALAGLLLSGMELDHMTTWKTFSKVDKFLILVPIMLNLKGNLEMNLSLRMATAANIGEIDNCRTRQLIVSGNMWLLQVQALIVASVAGILSFGLGAKESHGNQPDLTMRGPVHAGKPILDKTARLRDGYFEFALVLAVSQLAASMSSAVQGSFICALVVWARKSGFDPDNMVIPIAGSLGDLCTLTLLGLIGAGLLYFEGTGIATLLFLGLITLCVVFMLATLRNVYVRELLACGWAPLFVATGLSSLAGVILEKNASQYPGYPLLAPIVAGMPSIAAAVHTSRLTSSLHAHTFRANTRPAHPSYMPLQEQVIEDSTSPPQRLDPASPFHLVWWKQFGSQLVDSLQPQIDEWTTPITIILNVVLIQAIFMLILRGIGSLQFGVMFYMCVIVLVSILSVFALFFAHTLCLFLWYWDYDPDTTCMPFTTAIVDVCAQLILLLAYKMAQTLGDRIIAL